MKRAVILAIIYAYQLLCLSHWCWAAPPEPGSPEAVVAKAMNAVNHGRINDFVERGMHPDALNEFRAAVLPEIDTGVERIGAAKLLEGFPGVKSVAALKALDAPKLFAAVVRRKTFDPSMKKSLASTKIEVYGHVSEGDETAHVIYRSTMNLGENKVQRINVATLRKSGLDWKMAIPEEMGGPMRRPGNGMPRIDLSARRVEPLGHVLAEQNTALILYRMTIPAGDSSISKLETLSLGAAIDHSKQFDPTGWRKSRNSSRNAWALARRSRRLPALLLVPRGRRRGPDSRQSDASHRPGTGQEPDSETHALGLECDHDRKQASQRIDRSARLVPRRRSRPVSRYRPDGRVTRGSPRQLHHAIRWPENQLDPADLSGGREAGRR